MESLRRQLINQTVSSRMEFGSPEPPETPVRDTVRRGAFRDPPPSHGAGVAQVAGEGEEPPHRSGQRGARKTGVGLERPEAAPQTEPRSSAAAGARQADGNSAAAERRPFKIKARAPRAAPFSRFPFCESGRFVFLNTPADLSWLWNAPDAHIRPSEPRRSGVGPLF